MEKIEEKVEKQKKNRLTEIFDQLTSTQIRYVTAMLEHKSKKDAAKYIGLSSSTVYNWKETPLIDEAIEIIRGNARDAAIAQLENNLFKAIAVKVAGLESENENIKQSASSEIIDRILGKPTQRNEFTGADGESLVIRVKVQDDD